MPILPPARRRDERSSRPEPIWLIPWWTFFAHGELRIITVYRDDRLCAMLPIVLEPTAHGCRGTLLGTGNTDHLEMLVDDRCREVATAMAVLARGTLRFHMVRLSGRIVAVHFGFQWRGRHYYYIGGFDPDFASLSVGSVLLHHAIRSAADEGASEFDFLRGAESYKYRWGATGPSYRRFLRRAVSA